MSDLIERLRRDGYIIGGWDEALSELEAQQAEIAEYKKQIKQMGSSVQHYEHLAMKFSSQADVYSHDRQRAWAEIARLREALRPFAGMATCVHDDWDDGDYVTLPEFKAGDYRRARAVWEKKQ